MLNRFTKDTGAADDDMPNTMISVMDRSFAIVATFIQVIVINWWTVGPMIIVGFFCIKINQMYTATIRALKRLEGNGNILTFYR